VSKPKKNGSNKSRIASSVRLLEQHIGVKIVGNATVDRTTAI